MTYIHTFSSYCKENNKLEAKISIFESSLHNIHLIPWNGTSSSEKWELILSWLPCLTSLWEWDNTHHAQNTFCVSWPLFNKSIPKKWDRCLPITFLYFLTSIMRKISCLFIHMSIHEYIWVDTKMSIPLVEWKILTGSDFVCFHYCIPSVWNSTWCIKNAPISVADLIM